MTSSKKRPLRTAIIVGTIAFCIAVAAPFIVSMLSNWEDERVAATLLESNPGAAQNRQQTDLVAAQVADLPALDSKANSTSPTSSQRTPAPAVEPPPIDDGWLKFSRTTFHLITKPEVLSNLAAEKLFRNKHLNPLDTKIPKAQRTLFDNWLEQAAKVLDEAQSNVNAIANQELSFMITRGLARYVSYKDLERSYSLERRDEIKAELGELRKMLKEAGATQEQIDATIADTKSFNDGTLEDSITHATRSGDDNIYLGDMARMPQTQQAAEIYYATAFGVYGEILTYFRRHQCIDDAIVSREMEKLDRLMQKYRL
jgi:hypothetical protein